MSNAKQASKEKRRRKALPVLGAAGLSLSLVSGSSAATGGLAADMLTRNGGATHEISLSEEEIFDSSLATFYVVNKENAGTFRPVRQLAMGGGGGCGGCAGCAAATYGAATPGNDAYLPQRSIKPTHPTKRTQVPRNP
jgi:hypothetical protein